MKTITELTPEQLEELKQAYLMQHLEEVEDRSPSYKELAEAGDIVPDCIIFEAYAGTMFSDDDFFCSAD